MISRRVSRFLSTIIAGVMTVEVMMPIIDVGFVMADTEIEDVTGLYYCWDEGEHKHSSGYDFDEASAVTDVNSSDTFGHFSISGDLIDVSGDASTFEVGEYSSQIVTFSYDIGDSVFPNSKDEWNIISDNSKVIDDINTSKKIKHGAIVVQTSLDGNNWVTNYEYTDALVSGNNFVDFYSTNDIQLLNGCYYRVVVAYEMGQRVEDRAVLSDIYEYKRIAEVYSFFIQTDIDNNTTTINTEPSYEYSDRYETGLDTGFSESNPISNDDVHSGWNLGHFIVNGYTSNQTDDNGNQVFLKNTDDRVALWFHLDQDINCLNGNENLSISEDTNGSDERFEVQETNFRHGTLIVRFTDYLNHTHAPMIYTDFLAANASMTADTRVQLFEEGNYEVTLDYEICEDAVIDKYTNYSISFSFSIRNGDCMVFPFELTDEEVNSGSAIATAYGRELLDGNITSNGFKLDFARSRYLSVNIERSDLIMSQDTGRLQLEVRDNSIAHDYDIYTKEGVYKVIAINQYTGSTTTKTFYVGDDPYLIALATSGKTLDEINELLAAGAEINELGDIIVATPTPTPTPSPVPTDPAESTVPAESTTVQSTPETEMSAEEAAPEENEMSSIPNKTIVVIVAVLVVLIIFVMVAFSVVRRGKKQTVGEAKKDTEKEDNPKDGKQDESNPERIEETGSEESGDNNED